MPSEFYSALGDIAAWTHTCGDNIIHSFTSNDSKQSRGYQIRRGQVSASIVGSPTENRFVVTYTFRVSDTVSESLDISSAREIRGVVNQANGPSDEQIIQNAAKDLVASQLSDEDMEEIRERMNDGDMDAAWDWEFSEGPAGETFCDGVKTIGYLYPYDDSFGAKDYDSVVYEVLYDGTTAANIVYDVLDVWPEDGDSEVATPPDEAGVSSRAFQ